MNQRNTPEESQQSRNPNCSQKILVVGIDGTIGSHLFANLPTLGFDVFGTSRNFSKLGTKVKYQDLEFPNLGIYHETFSAAIICASVTDISTCENDPVRSRRINVTGTIALIDSLLKANCFVIFLSSNAIFDGKKAFATIEDLPNPKTNYGLFKLEVEMHLKKSKSEGAVVLRLTKLVTNETKFIAFWHSLAAKRQPIPAFTNKMLSPISIDEVFSSICIILKARRSGLFQVGGLEEVSYFDFAKNYFRNDSTCINLLAKTLDSSIQRDEIQYNSLITFLPT